MKIKVYAPDETFIEQIDVDKEHAIGTVYTLTNGLTLTLGEGDLIQGEIFTVSVDALDPLATGPAQPEWITGTAVASFTGTYNGSLGSGTMTFVVDREGVHGEDDLKLKAYAPDGSFVEDINVHHSHPLGQTYTLSSGLNVTFGAGDMIKGESFTLDLSTSTVFSTTPADSTATATMGGVYDGSQGTGPLKFKIAQGGVHGTDNLAIEIRDADDSLIETLNIASTDPLNQVYALSNGLSFQLSSGLLQTDEWFAVSVDHLTPTAVDPNKAFNETGNDRPNFDDGLAVTAGSFDVNGVSIVVSATDTINSVLTKINQSAADVTAVFDVATESVVLTRNTIGPEYSIVVDNDTSGFLVATKLAGAVPTNGATSATPLDQVTSLSAISSGQIMINGVGIAIDVTTDSIDDIVSRINSSGAGVTATFDANTNRLTIAANTLTDLQLGSNGTNFFETLTISTGTYKSTQGSTASPESATIGPQTRDHVTRSMRKLTRANNDIFDTSHDELLGTSLGALRQQLRQAVGESFDPQGGGGGVMKATSESVSISRARRSLWWISMPSTRETSSRH